MREKLLALLERTAEEVSGAQDISALEEVRVRVLGRKDGELTVIMRSMGKLPAEERPEIGKLVNQVKAQIEEAISARKKALSEVKAVEVVPDLTLPGRRPRVGRAHLINRVTDQLVDIFYGMGFEVALGPEVESEYYNFECLNFPPDHPARDMQDTLYVKGGGVFRTHTSPVQIRYMLEHQPPIRMVCPGRVFRADVVDASHSPVFHQIEGLLVDKMVRMSDLKGLLAEMAKQLYGAGAKVNLRPSFFPFTEPSAEFDIVCVNCEGAGCSTCGQKGRIEIGGAGMVHQEVFQAVGYDKYDVTGLAFGLGIDRLAMMMCKIGDLRLLFENDLRFLAGV